MLTPVVSYFNDRLRNTWWSGFLHASPSYPYLFSVFLGSALIFCIGFSGSATRSDNILKLFLDINLADQNQPRAEEDTAASSVQDMRQMLEARLYAGPVELLDFVREGFRRLNKKSSSSEEEEKDGARPEIIQSDNFFITPSLESGTAQQIQYRYYSISVEAGLWSWIRIFLRIRIQLFFSMRIRIQL